MSKFKDAMEDVRKHAEKTLGKSWDEIVKQAKEDDKRQAAKKDPIAESYKKGSISPKRMFKKEMDKLK